MVLHNGSNKYTFVHLSLLQAHTFAARPADYCMRLAAHQRDSAVLEGSSLCYYMCLCDWSQHSSSEVSFLP